MKEQLNLLIISNSYWKYKKGGAELQIYYFLNSITRNKINISYVFLSDERINSTSNINEFGIRKKPFLEKLFGSIIYFYSVYKIIHKIKPNIIYHRNISTLSLPIVLFSKTLTILHIASDIDLNKNIGEFLSLKSILDYFGRVFVIYRFKSIIVQTKCQAELLEKRFGRKADLIIYNGHPFPIEPICKKNDPLQIVWAANLKYEKQPELFIELSNRINIHGVNFIMIGRLPNSKYGKELLNKINNSKNLIYIGEQSLERVNKYLSESHIFINTSLYEGFPNTFIQAWMRKVPVVSLNVDPDNVIKNNNLGLRSVSFENMVNDVKKLIFDKSLREKMGENAQKYAFQNHSLNNFEQLKSLMELEVSIDN